MTKCKHPKELVREIPLAVKMAKEKPPQPRPYWKEPYTHANVCSNCYYLVYHTNIPFHEDILLVVKNPNCVENDTIVVKNPNCVENDTIVFNKPDTIIMKKKDAFKECPLCQSEMIITEVTSELYIKAKYDKKNKLKHLNSTGGYE